MDRLEKGMVAMMVGMLVVYAGVIGFVIWVVIVILKHFGII